MLPSNQQHNTIYRYRYLFSGAQCEVSLPSPPRPRESRRTAAGTVSAAWAGAFPCGRLHPAEEGEPSRCCWRSGEPSWCRHSSEPSGAGPGRPHSPHQPGEPSKAPFLQCTETESHWSEISVFTTSPLAER